MNTTFRRISAVATAVAALAFAPAAFAADSAATAAVPAAAAAVTVTTQSLNIPAIATVNVPASRSRAEVKAEAVEFVAHYKTALQVQQELSKN